MRTISIASLLILVPLALTSVTALSGCLGADALVETEQTRTVFRRIDANLINSLMPGEDIVIERTPDTSWIFDGSKGAIDYSRITIVCPGNVRMPMTTWFAQLGAAPDAGHTGQWILAGDPKDFGTLDPDQQQDMRDYAVELLEAYEQGFRFEPFDQYYIDGTTYWVCGSDQMFACEGDSNWYPL